jgi:hypothetical protein
MNFKAILAVTALSTGAALVSAPAFSQTTTDRTVTVMGDIVRYEPGHVIVVRDSSNKEVSYTLNSSSTVPSDLAVGRHVTLYTTRGDDGSSTVTRVTTSMTPAGNVKKTVERTHTDANGDTQSSTSTSINGRVQAYEPGHSVTVTRDDGTQVTYLINEHSHLPAGLAVGKTIVVHPTPDPSDPTRLWANTVTYTETKTKTEHGRTTTHTKTKTKEVGSN